MSVLSACIKDLLKKERNKSRNTLIFNRVQVLYATFALSLEYGYLRVLGTSSMIGYLSLIRRQKIGGIIWDNASGKHGAWMLLLYISTIIEVVIVVGALLMLVFDLLPE
ncbi:MAG: hypothetical protein JKX73_09960 [Flavobacteriales bacterium]|nr:hypothetical protein [Flavobacteriales bacterium]